jgi:5'-3' exonuclease
MGTKLFHSYLKENIPNSIKKLSLYKYQNQILVVDVSNFLYKFLYSQGSKYLIGFMLFYRSLLKHNIFPIFCFDGKPPVEKKPTLEKRQKIRSQKQEIIDEMKKEYYKTLFLLENSENIDDKDNVQQHDMNDMNDIMEYCNNLQEQIRVNTQKCVQITSKVLNNLKLLFDILGIKYIQACDSVEADRLIGLIIRQKVGDGCISNDIDPLIHGATKLLYDFNYKSSSILEYNSGDIMNTLQISHRQLVMMTVLLGCDYTPKVKHVSSALLVEIAKTSNSIKMVAERLTRKGYPYLSNNLNIYEKAFQIYYEMSKLNDVIASDNLFHQFPTLNDEDLLKLINLLTENSGEYNTKLVKRCYKDIKNCYQNGFTDIFTNVLTVRLTGKYVSTSPLIS